MATEPKFPVTGNRESDLLLEKDPLALLIGMLLDQQIPMEKAFSGPSVIKERMGSLDVKKIASMNEEKFVKLCSEKPAIHRFPRSMAIRIQDMCQILIDDFDGKAVTVWQGQKDAKDVYERLRTLPGFGEGKAKIFLAILVKRFGQKFVGFEKVVGSLAGKNHTSVADVSDAESLAKVRAHKKAMKAKVKAKAG